MPRNIVILLDGTSNEITRKRSNVLRLYGTLSKTPGQIVYYDPGVGTFGADNAWSNAWRRLHEFWGMITGWGLDQNVKEAYRFLAETYDDGKRSDGPDEEPDRIYIFGFSRGAYSARVLAGFIHAVGLLNPVNMNLLDYAYRAYKSVGEGGSVEDNLDGKAFAEVRLFERILRSPRPVIRCLGLFDTVASVIEWRRFRPTLKSHVFTRNNASVQAVRHALAIDERRTMFQPQLWGERREYWGGPFRPPTPEAQDVNEVWFTGVHGDIGGGYPEDRSALAKIPLEWMIDETRALLPQRDTNALNTVGYKELFQHLDGTLSLEEAVELVITRTRQFAKRQMTWFKKDPKTTWFSYESKDRSGVMSAAVAHAEREVKRLQGTPLPR